MRFGDDRESSNFTDDTGRGGGGLRRRRLGGGGLGCLLPLIASRFGIGGVVVLRDRLFPAELARRAWRRRQRSAPSSQHSRRAGGAEQPRSRRPSISCCRCSRSTEDTWSQAAPAKGIHYTPTNLVISTRSPTSRAAARRNRRWGRSTARPTRTSISTPNSSTSCRSASSAPGDFAMAYVDRARGRPSRPGPDGHARPGASSCRRAASETEGNAIQVKIELQADCYAGVWAANAKDPEGQPVMEQGDFEEGMRAAEAIGDDTLQTRDAGHGRPRQLHPRHLGAAHGSASARLQERRPERLQVALEPDQHLAGVRAPEQAEEGVGHVLEPVDDGLARFDRAVASHGAISRVEFRHAREIIEDDEALEQDARGDDRA